MKDKLKKCKAKGCAKTFKPSSSLQTWCSPACGFAISLARLATAAGRAKIENTRKQRVLKERIKTRSDHMRDTQKSFNAYIRARDAGNGCISCGSTTAAAYHAGHYLTTKARPELRFEPINCHLQCSSCNMYLSGNLIMYRKRLIAKIGQESVDWLEGQHDLTRYTIDELKSLKTHYNNKTREAKNESK